jgi:N-acetylglucosamine-6-sulfatase
VKVHKGEYSTDLVKDKALDYLDTALDEDRPFFLGIAPIACHSCKLNRPLGGTRWTIADPLTQPGLSKIDTKLEHIQADIPASHPRHARLFPTEHLPRTESWNPEEPQGVSWVRTLPRLVSDEIGSLTEM